MNRFNHLQTHRVWPIYPAFTEDLQQSWSVPAYTKLPMIAVAH